MPQASPTPATAFSREAVRGTFWSYLTFAAGKLLNFATTIILARLLVPEQFGLVGYCTIAIQYLDILNTAGIDSALIARKEKLEEAANAAFVVNIIMGLASFGIAWLLAPQVARFFKAEEVSGLFRVLALVLPLSGLGRVPDTLLQRSLRFRTRMIPNVARNITKGLASVTLALMGWGPWSLVWGQIAGEAITTGLSWLLAGWRPTWRFSRQITREMMGYGTHIIIIGFAGALHDNVDYIIVGRALGAVALGVYTMAYRIPELTIRSLNEVAAQVLFPILSRKQSDGVSLRAFYLGYIRYVALFTFSFGTGLALISRLFVENFMSAKWEAAVIPMALISIALALGSVGYTPGVLYKAINRPEILTRVNLAKLPVIIAVLIFCARWGINGVAAGQVIFAVLAIGFDCFVVSRIVKFKFVELAGALAPAAIASVSMAAVLSVIEIAFAPAGWLSMGAVVLAGVATYAVALSVISRETLTQVFSAVWKEVSPWLVRRAPG